jgi:hypothetical protein
VEEVAFGPGAWENELPPAVRATFVRNAPTFLDELQDPTQLSSASIRTRSRTWKYRYT